MKKFENWYNSNYKKILIIPAIVLTLSLLYLIFFYTQTGDIIHKDVTLTGGTSITVLTQESAQDLEAHLSKTIQDFEIKTISDNTGTQIELIIMAKDQAASSLKSSLEEFLGYELTPKTEIRDRRTTTISIQILKVIFILFVRTI